MFSGGCMSLAVLCGVSLCPASEGLAAGARVLDAVYSTGGPACGDGAESRQRPGCALGENPNLGFPEAETPGVGCLVSIKGTLCGSLQEEAAPRLSLGTGLTTRSHSSLR